MGRGRGRYSPDMSTGRIVFADSPWPEGHPIERFRLTLRGDEQGNLRLHVHVMSAPYESAGSPVGAPAGSSPWNRPETWLDAQYAILSSLHWGNRGFKLPSKTSTFEEHKLDGMVLTADPVKQVSLDNPLEDLAVGAWVLGNGVVGDHRISLTRVRPYVFDVNWTGSLRNSFLGEENFGHRFEVNAESVRLS